jgi:ATP-dependent RNA helicase DDX60
MASSTPSPPSPSPASPILSWYDTSCHRRLDLVGDYAGQEHFLIDGDSLLRDCFGDSRLDFLHGWQVLHAVYAVERFLGALVVRHCRFSVAFFDGTAFLILSFGPACLFCLIIPLVLTCSLLSAAIEHRELCVPAGVLKGRRSKFLMTRTIIIRHLALNLPPSLGVHIHDFTSLHSKDFRRFLEASPIHFIMAHDGALPATGDVCKELNVDGRAKVLLRGNIWRINKLGLSVALINRVEFRDSKVSFFLLCTVEFASCYLILPPPFVAWI